MNKIKETPYVTFELINGIIIATYKPSMKITLKLAKEIVRTRLEFSEHKDLPALILNQGIIKMDKDARDFLASSEGIKGLKCAAILINSSFISITVNFFLKVTKPKIIVKTFTEKEAALAWLQSFVNN